MYVYELSHLYYIFENTPCYSPKILGYYTDKMNLDNAILYYDQQPGFCDVPNGFVVKKREIHGKFNNIFVFSASIFAHTNDFLAYDDMIDLGLYANEELASEAIQRFYEDNDRFFKSDLLEIEKEIGRWQVNQCISWIEGFTVEDVNDVEDIIS